MSYLSTVLITGGSSGLGYETALQLAQPHLHLQIVIAARTGTEAAETINQTSRQSNVTYIKLDLSSHSTTQTFVEEYLSKGFPPISALILNAGHQSCFKVQFSPDGEELMFAINHVNHALLFFLLKDRLVNDARIILISSSTHDPARKRVPPPDFTSGEAAAHPSTGKQYDTIAEGNRRYALSKLCNVLFAYAIHDNKTRPWIGMALDPGVMPTGLYRWLPWPVSSIFRWYFSSIIGQYFIKDLYQTSYVAETLCKMATSPEFGDPAKSGKYYGVVGAKEIKSSVQSYEMGLQGELWDWTVREVAKGDEVETFHVL